ncbi:hypothetical protein BDV93DRAFT_142294 [Ceratobasidium sp. AG-I]|nr:hypothetical protein BDV93DRAFT_142294 [Ceratobasidium sp. AG-I]
MLWSCWISPDLGGEWVTGESRARERRALQEGHGSAYTLLGCLDPPGPVVLRVGVWVFGSSGEIGITEYRPSIQYCRGRQGEEVGKATLQMQQSYLHRYRRQFSVVANRTTPIPTAPHSPHQNQAAYPDVSAVQELDVVWTSSSVLLLPKFIALLWCTASSTRLCCADFHMRGQGCQRRKEPRKTHVLRTF